MTTTDSNSHRYILESVTSKLTEMNVPFDVDSNPDIVINSNDVFGCTTAIEVETSTVSKPSHIIKKLFDVSESSYEKLVFAINGDKNSHDNARRIDTILSNPFFAHSLTNDNESILYKTRKRVKEEDGYNICIPIDYSENIQWIHEGENKYRAHCTGSGGEIVVNFTLGDNGVLKPSSDNIVGRMTYNNSTNMYDVFSSHGKQSYDTKKGRKYENCFEHDWKILSQPIFPPIDNTDIMETLKKMEYLIVTDNGIIFRRTFPWIEPF